MLVDHNTIYWCIQRWDAIEPWCPWENPIIYLLMQV